MIFHWPIPTEEEFDDVMSVYVDFVDCIIVERQNVFL